jgi:hypothetical protein
MRNVDEVTPFFCLQTLSSLSFSSLHNVGVLPHQTNILKLFCVFFFEKERKLKELSIQGEMIYPFQ